MQSDPDYTKLTSILERYQIVILLAPIPESNQAPRLARWQKQAQSELWQPLPYHRTKWLTSIENARTLLLKLEQNAKNIKVQRTQREVIKDLAQKRLVVKKLRSKVEEIGREVDTMNRNSTRTNNNSQDDGETMYDILTQIRAEAQHKDPGPETQKESLGATTQDTEDTSKARDQLFETSSVVRRRKGEESNDHGTSSGFSDPAKTEESLLATSAKHESITKDLLSMAAQLKQQAQAFNFALDQDKGFVDRAVEGLEQNMSAMGIASKGMKTLQRMSEEQGFWGRLKMQAFILFLWICVFLLVFVVPKLRF